MAHTQLTSQSLLRCLRQSYRASLPSAQHQLQCTRSLSSTSAPNAEAESAAAAASSSTTPASSDSINSDASKQPFYKNPDPNLVISPRLERRLVRAGTPPIGSRRRRAALQSSDHIPFEQMPYQCFQEARKLIMEDRAEKLKEIERERVRLEKLIAMPAEQLGGENGKYTRVYGLRRRLELLKIQADINDPIVKRKFEDGEGDMSRPIYRFLADRKWREYRRPVLEQRITQMKVVPDVLANIDPILDVKLFFNKAVQPGDFVNSAVSATPPKLNIQAFTGDPKLVTIAVVDSDVPVMVIDSFITRCHFLAVNVPLTPTTPKVNLGELAADSQVILPWFPPYAHKGTPYHRLTTVILEQKQRLPLDVKKVAEKAQREEFSIRALQSRYKLKAIGIHMFRNEWDEQTPDVMNQHNIPGADIEFKRRKAESLPYKRRDTRRMR